MSPSVLGLFGSNSWIAQRLFYRCRYLLIWVLVLISFTPDDYHLISGLIGLKCWILGSSIEIPVLGPTRGRFSFLQPILHAFHMCQSTARAEATKPDETSLFASWFVCFLSNLAENFKYINISPNFLHNE